MIIRPVAATDAGAWERMREALWPGDPHAADIAAFLAGRSPELAAVLVCRVAPTHQWPSSSYPCGKTCRAPEAR